MLDRARATRSEAGAGAVPPLVETRGLAFEAAGQRLIDGIDLALGARGVTVVMGPNGAGKSLLLRLLHGMIAPSSGEILWSGRPADEATRLRQAMVFQRPVLLRRSVAANIDFVLGLRGRGRDAKTRDRLLDHVGLLDRARQPARALSGGEQQRLTLARALALEPEMLFLDEPTASLDPAATLAIERLVEEADAGGTRIVFVTHDIGQARRLADEVLFLHKGRVAEQTPAKAFFARPASRAARDYLAGRLVL